MEGDAALCQLFGELMGRLGDATVLGWTGQSSSYNSCIPASLSFHPKSPQGSLAIEDAEMDGRISELKSSMSQTQAMLIYNQVMRLPSARFSHRKLYLPCILFQVQKLVEKLDAEIAYRIVAMSQSRGLVRRSKNILSLKLLHPLWPPLNCMRDPSPRRMPIPGHCNSSSVWNSRSMLFCCSNNHNGSTNGSLLSTRSCCQGLNAASLPKKSAWTL